jgi:peptide/nickel transport system substrate-binding protein
VRREHWFCVALALVGSGCPRSSGRDAGVALAPAAWLAGELPPETGTPVDGGTLVVRLSSEPAGMNLLHDQYQDGWARRCLVGTVYETLFEIDRQTAPRYELKPLLAESHEASGDHLTDTLHLRRGVKFHDGTVFTARDVKAVLDAVMNPKFATGTLRAFFTDLAGYSTPDDFTLVVRWKRANYFGFRSLVTSLPMVPAASLSGDFDKLALARAPIGTGPFRFEAWETGSEFRLARNPDYWGRPAHLSRIVFRIVRDHAVATELWQRGDFDLMTQLQPEVWRSVERPDPANAWAVSGYNRIRADENNYSWIGWNEERAFFKDVRVRRALGMLVPYQRVYQDLQLGLETPTTCPFYVHSPYCDPQVQALAYDPAGARKLLAEAGWKPRESDGVLEKDGVPFKVSFLTNAHSVFLGKLGPVLQEEYRKVGIELEIENAEWAVFIHRLLEHQFDMASLLWAQLDVETDLFQTFHTSQSRGSNYVSYGNPEVDSAIVALRSEFDPPRRVELAHRLHRLLYEDQVYAFISERPNLDAAKKTVHGLKPAITWYDLRSVWIEGARP